MPGPDRPRALPPARPAPPGLADDQQRLEDIFRAFGARLDAFFAHLRAPAGERNGGSADADRPLPIFDAAAALGIAPRTLRALEHRDPRYQALRVRLPGNRKRLYSARRIAELRARGSAAR